MLSYISRRRRWWKMLQQMDSSVNISDEVLGDLLLDSAMLTEDQKRMVLTVTDGETTFDEIAKVLMDQHNEQTRKEAVRTDKIPPRAKWKKGGYVAYEDDDYDDGYSNFDEAAFQAAIGRADACEEDGQEEDWEYDEVFDIDEKTAIELDTVTAFWAETEEEPTDEVEQQISDAAQTQVAVSYTHLTLPTICSV